MIVRIGGRRIAGSGRNKKKKTLFFGVWLRYFLHGNAYGKSSFMGATSVDSDFFCSRLKVRTDPC